LGALEFAEQPPDDGPSGYEGRDCEGAGLDQEIDQNLDCDSHQERQHGAEQRDSRGNGQFRPRGKAVHAMTARGQLSFAISFVLTS
jgi:hypothetical protein